MRLTALPTLGSRIALRAVLCAGVAVALARADRAAAAPAGSSIATVTQRTLAAGARHHSSPLKRYRRHRAP